MFPLGLVISTIPLYLTTSKGCVNERIEYGRSYVNVSIIDISDCFFSRTSTFIGKGGVIYCISDNIFNISLDNSMFYQCSSDDYGGAIIFKGKSAILKMVCANRCYAKAKYHFAQIVASTFVDYFSMSNCSFETNGSYSFEISSSDPKIDRSNFSNNNAAERPVFYCYGISSIHCTIANNIAQRYGLETYWQPFTMSFANIIANKIPLGGLFVMDHSYSSFSYCIFDLNLGRLFTSGYKSSITLSHCMLTHNGSVCDEENSFTLKTNNSFINSFPFETRSTYQMQFYYTYYCPADITFVPETPLKTLNHTPLQSAIETPDTTIIPTLESTKEKTQEPSSTFKNTPAKSPEPSIIDDNKKDGSKPLLPIAIGLILLIVMVTGFLCWRKVNFENSSYQKV